MILKPSDLKKMIDAWLDKGHAIDLDLETGKLSVQPKELEKQVVSQFDLVDMRRKK